MLFTSEMFLARLYGPQRRLACRGAPSQPPFPLKFRVCERVDTGLKFVDLAQRPEGLSRERRGHSLADPVKNKE